MDARERNAPRGRSATGYTGDYTPGVDAREVNAPRGRSATGYTGETLIGSPPNNRSRLNAKGPSATGYTGNTFPGNTPNHRALLIAKGYTGIGYTGDSALGTQGIGAVAIVFSALKSIIQSTAGVSGITFTFNNTRQKMRANVKDPQGIANLNS